MHLCRTVECETRSVLGITGNGQTFLHWSAPAPALQSGNGNCPRANKGGFWVGFPTQVQEEEQTSVSLDGSVARPGWGWLQSLCVGNPGMPLYVPVFSSGRQSFPRKVSCQSSKFGLAYPREKETCLHLCGNQSVQRQDQSYSGRLPWPLFSGQLPGPHTHPASLPYNKGSVQL